MSRSRSVLLEIYQERQVEILADLNRLPWWRLLRRKRTAERLNNYRFLEAELVECLRGLGASDES